MTTKPIENPITMKTISLIAATFLTVALSSPAVNAGRVPFNGTYEAHEVTTPFSDPSLGFFSNGEGTLTSTALGPLAMFFNVLVDVATSDGVGRTRLIDANGDSIFTYSWGHGDLVSEDPPVSHITGIHIVTGGTGRYAGARGSFVEDRMLDLSTFDSSGTFNGVIIVRGAP
jgi:hypothetical protein